ncbi:MAG: hypothetical protein V4547_17605 [Bacteroidota bacterium]
MSTRSTLKFYSEFNQENVIATIYQHYDGYIGGVGHELAEWLKKKKIINGICNETMQDGFANGMGCLAAQFIAEHKVSIGGFSLTHETNKQEYNYSVRYINKQFIIEVDNIFKGTPDELLNFVEDNED